MSAAPFQPVICHGPQIPAVVWRHWVFPRQGAKPMKPMVRAVGFQVLEDQPDCPWSEPDDALVGIIENDVAVR